MHAVHVYSLYEELPCQGMTEFTSIATHLCPQAISQFHFLLHSVFN